MSHVMTTIIVTVTGSCDTEKDIEGFCNDLKLELRLYLGKDLRK